MILSIGVLGKCIIPINSSHWIFEQERLPSLLSTGCTSVIYLSKTVLFHHRTKLDKYKLNSNKNNVHIKVLAVLQTMLLKMHILNNVDSWNNLFTSHRCYRDVCLLWRRTSSIWLVISIILSEKNKLHIQNKTNIL